MARYNRFLRDLIVDGRAKPGVIVTQRLPLDAAPEAYAKFSERAPGYTKVVLRPGLAACGGDARGGTTGSHSSRPRGHNTSEGT